MKEKYTTMYAIMEDFNTNHKKNCDNVGSKKNANENLLRMAKKIHKFSKNDSINSTPLKKSKEIKKKDSYHFKEAENSDKDDISCGKSKGSDKIVKVMEKDNGFKGLKKA